MRYAFFGDGGTGSNAGMDRIRVKDNDAHEVGRTGWHDTMELARVEAREIVGRLRKASTAPV